MAQRVTWFPAVLPSASPLVLDTAADSPICLKWLEGIGPLPGLPINGKGPSQEGETVFDVAVPPRVISAQALVDATDLEDLWDARGEIATALVNIPVRPGEFLNLGRLLFERDGFDDREIYGMPRSSTIEWIRAPHKGMLDAEWHCPYPYFQPTSDTSATFDRLVTLLTSAEADDIIDATAHGFVAGDTVVFVSKTGGAGLTVGTTYYVIAANLTADTFQISATPGGSAVNFTTDITAGTVAPVVTLANPGDVDAPIVAKLYGPATEVTLTNLTTGEVFTVTVTLLAGEWLQVDTTPGKKSVRKYTAVDTWSNAISGLDLADGRLWLLRPGNNSVRYAAVGDGSGTHAEITYRPRYAGL